MIHLFFSRPCFYVITRLLWPLPWPLVARVGIAVVLLAASQYW